MANLPRFSQVGLRPVGDVDQLGLFAAPTQFSRPPVGRFNLDEALAELARRDQPLPVDEGGATYSSFAPPFDFFQQGVAAKDLGNELGNTMWSALDPKPFPPPPEAPQLLQQGVSGEQRYTPKADMVSGRIPIPPEDVGTNLGGFGGSADETLSGEPTSTVPIDQVNRDSDPTRFAPPTDLVGGSFFSGPNQTGEPVNPGSGFRYTDNVLKGAAGHPYSELRALNREDAPWQKFVGPAMTAVGMSQIPGAGLLGLFASGLNKLGAYHRFNPAADSNLFADPETGRATWGTTDPGGSGSQRGTLNLYNMLQDLGGRYPSRQVQTPSRTIYHDDDSSTVIPQYANARDLAYIMGQGDRPPPGLYTQQAPFGYQDFGGNVTNQEALIDYNRTGSGAILNQAGAILGPDAGYNETRDLAASMADDLQGQMDFAQSDIAPGYSGEDWGYW